MINSFHKATDLPQSRIEHLLPWGEHRLIWQGDMIDTPFANLMPRLSCVILKFKNVHEREAWITHRHTHPAEMQRLLDRDYLMRFNQDCWTAYCFEDVFDYTQNEIPPVTGTLYHDGHSSLIFK